MKLSHFFSNVKKSGGRTNSGRITAFHRGGGYKRFIGFVDHKRQLYGIPCRVIKILKFTSFYGYCGHYALVYYVTGVFSVILATNDMKEGMYLVSGTGYEKYDFISVFGSTRLLYNSSVGDTVCDIEVVPGSGGMYARAAGTYGTVLKTMLNDKDVLIRLPSREIRVVDGYCHGVRGQISNVIKRDIIIGKAGINRNFGWRPIVRGVAMNPIDHPHGGNTAGGRPSVTPWGRLTKGKPTRKKTRRAINVVVSRRKAVSAS